MEVDDLTVNVVDDDPGPEVRTASDEHIADGRRGGQGSETRAWARSDAVAPMRRDELEHAIRAATQIIAQDEILIIGSQSILGTYTEDQLPAEATASEEVDMAPMSERDADARHST